MTSYIVGTFLYQNMIPKPPKTATPTSRHDPQDYVYRSEGTKDFRTSAGYDTARQQISFPGNK
uniref:Uncharacterized protein n=1 Tax=Setaria italica TaxID=4555 RepID=K3ZBM2_SETIT